MVASVMLSYSAACNMFYYVTANWSSAFTGWSYWRGLQPGHRRYLRLQLQGGCAGAFWVRPRHSEEDDGPCSQYRHPLRSAPTQEQIFTSLGRRFEVCPGWIVTPVCFFLRLGCGAGQCGWTAARHAHLSHRPQEVRFLVQGTIPLPGRTFRATRPWEEVPTQPASVPWHGLCVTAVEDVGSTRCLNISL